MATSDSFFDRILVPVDFSPASDDLIDSGHAVRVGNQHLDFAPASTRSVQIAAALARQHGSNVLLVHATPTLDYSAMYTGPAGLALPGKNRGRDP